MLTNPLFRQACAFGCLISAPDDVPHERIRAVVGGNEVKIVLNYLIQNPLLFQVKYKTVRTAYTQIFPYGIHYHLNEKTKTITVLGIFHTSISPDKWLKRL